MTRKGLRAEMEKIEIMKKNLKKMNFGVRKIYENCKTDI